MSDEVKLNHDVLEEHLLNRPVSNLTDLQYTYGVIAVAASEADGENAPFLTPSEAEHLYGEENSLISVDVDFRGSEPTIDGVSFFSYTREQRDDVAYSRYDVGNGADHSITHRGGQDPDLGDIRDYLVQRLTSWPTKDPVRKVAESSEDGELINHLPELGNDEEELSTIDEEIQTELSETGNQQPLVTVRINRGDGWEWPGDIDVFQEAMRARSTHKAKSKSNFSQPSSGTSVDMVTGDETELVGAAPAPLRHFRTKQQSTFQGLDNVEAAWMSHPVSGTTSRFFTMSGRFLSSAWTSVFNHRAYFLPYPTGVVTPEDAEELYALLNRIESDSEPLPSILLSAEASGNSWLEDEGVDWNYYVVLLEYDQNTLFNLRAELPRVSRPNLISLATNHAELVDSPLIDHGQSADGERGLFTGYTTDDDELDHEDKDYPPFTADISDETTLAEMLVWGWYGQRYLPGRGEDFSAADFRVRLYQTMLDGDVTASDENSGNQQYTGVDVEELLQESIEYIEDREGDEFPKLSVVNSYVRLRMLANSGLLSATDTRQASLCETDSFKHSDWYSQNTMEEDNSDTDSNPLGVRQQDRLDEFVDASAGLSDDTREAVFKAGVLIGSLADYQSYKKNLSTTIADKHPISRMGAQRLQTAVNEAIEKAIVYANEGHNTVCPGYVSAARDALTTVDLDESDLSKSDFKFAYALGVSYGFDEYVPPADADAKAAN